MREFVKISTKEAVLQTLRDFSHVFPHLEEKIESLEAYAEKLARFAQCYLGREDGTVFGLVIFYANNLETKTAYISLIGVKNSSQGRGFGYWLLSQCETAAKTLGMTQISLEVDCDNETAQRFYKRNGFAVSGKTERNSMYMRKPLLERNNYDGM